MKTVNMVTQILLYRQDTVLDTCKLVFELLGTNLTAMIHLIRWCSNCLHISEYENSFDFCPFPVPEVKMAGVRSSYDDP